MKRKTNKGAFSILSFLLVIVILLSSLNSCFLLKSAKSSEEIEENISASLQRDSKKYDYVALYLSDWGFPRFNAQKLAWVEQVFFTYYNYEGGLDDDPLQHAAETARHFIENYYDNIDLSDYDTVTDAVITSYVDTVKDPYAIYRLPEIYEDYDTEMSGKFGGIGVVIEYDHQNETLMISSVNLDSPAERAGFKVGDYIIAVDGRPLEEMGYLNAVNFVRGEIGTDVSITVKRGAQTLELVATRALVEEKTVGYSIDNDKLGYIQVTGFKGNTYEQFVEAVDYMEQNGALGIIFDMRGNPGGYLNTVCDMISYLIPTGKTIVSYKYKNSIAQQERSTDDVHPVTKKTFDHKINIPVVVLCNEYTASAGEIFTAAIRDYRDMGVIKAKTVGATTYKKGIMQSTFLYEDNSSVTFTIAYYNPPSGKNYHGIGVTPDVVISNSDTEDLQYKKAVEELKKLINAN